MSDGELYGFIKKNYPYILPITNSLLADNLVGQNRLIMGANGGRKAKQSPIYAGDDGGITVNGHTSYSEALIILNDNWIDLPENTQGEGFVAIQNNDVEWAKFVWNKNGDPVVSISSLLVENSDSGNCIRIYNASGKVRIKNKLGTPEIFAYTITYTS